MGILVLVVTIVVSYVLSYKYVENVHELGGGGKDEREVKNSKSYNNEGRKDSPLVYLCGQHMSLMLMDYLGFFSCGPLSLCNSYFLSQI
jgi:hypothetical protein